VSGNGVGADRNEKRKSNMIKKLLGAAAMAALLSSPVPASAAKMMMMGCSGPNLEKTETMVEGAAEGAGKYMAQKEIALAQASMLDGKMGACAMHLTKAMQDGMMQQNMMQQGMMEADSK
jgi:hypothetical protein